jgi:hypothetical protein
MYIVLSLLVFVQPLTDADAEIARYFDGYDLERIAINEVVIFRRSMNTASFVALT